jgi:hypothetical protein
MAAIASLEARGGTISLLIPWPPHPGPVGAHVSPERLVRAPPATLDRRSQPR